MKIKIKITKQENINFYKCKKNDIIEIDFEQYIATVVMSEIGTSNLEAAKAQAIAARTYAVYKGVLVGKVISDSASIAQSYRAPRYASGLYPICVQGANETKGQILSYNGKIINAVYSDSNGGRTYSAKEVWGSAKAYLIAQTDAWDAAVGKKKNGHGVGMSQSGCKYAAKHGIGHKEILQFYYPGTTITSCYSEQTDEIKKIRELILAAIEEL